jgi:hypothetical protein
MTQDEIIEMARQAGLTVTYIGDPIGLSYAQIAHFAKLVAAKEREACAVVAEDWFCGCGRGSCSEGDRRAHDIADSIRARGEAS